jgi:hypothetical protein
MQIASLSACSTRSAFYFWGGGTGGGAPFHTVATERERSSGGEMLVAVASTF